MSLIEADARKVSAAPRDKPKRLSITKPVAAAIDLMVEQGKRWDEAALECGMTTRAMRLALEKPHVLAYLRERKYVFRAAISAGNIHALADLRDSSDNAMAKLGAIKVLEQIENETSTSSARSQAPGFAIIVVNGTQAAAPVTIEQKPSTAFDDCAPFDVRNADDKRHSGE